MYSSNSAFLQKVETIIEIQTNNFFDDMGKEFFLRVQLKSTKTSSSKSSSKRDSVGHVNI